MGTKPKIDAGRAYLEGQGRRSGSCLARSASPEGVYSSLAPELDQVKKLQADEAEATSR